MSGLGGIVGTVLGYLGYQIGQRTDNANDAGSAHAKLKHIDDHLNALITGTPFHLKTPTLTKASVKLESSGTFLSINGPRLILGGAIMAAGDWNDSYKYRTSIRLIIDGTVVVDQRADNNYEQYGGFRTAHNQGAYYSKYSEDYAGGQVFYEYVFPIYGPFKINSSLVVYGERERDSADFAAVIWHVPV